MAAVTPTATEPPAANQEVISELIDGNRRFAAGEPLLLCKPDAELVKKLASGQKPKAIVLGCSDSRCPPELVFDQGLGDLFIIRVAGNLVSQHALGSILYAVSHLGTNLVIVLGHTQCGAVAATVDAFKAGASHEAHKSDDPIHSLVATMHQVVHHCHTNGHADKEDAEFKGEVVIHNSKASAREVVDSLKKQLPAERQSQVTVAAALYHIEDGTVDLLETLAVGSA